MSPYASLARSVNALGAFAFAIAVLLVDGSAWALGPENVLVLYNADQGDQGAGYQIAQHYQNARSGVHLAGISGLNSVDDGYYQNAPDPETISAANYLSVIRPQVLDQINAIESATGHSIDVIVTTKGMPLRINAGVDTGASFSWKQYSSLESELTRIDSIDTVDKMGDQFFYIGFPSFDPTLASNPYYLADTPFQRQGSDPLNADIRLSSRLDGYSVDSVTAAIDRAQQAYFVPYGQTIIADDDNAASIDQMTDTVNGFGPGLVELIESRYPDAEDAGLSAPILFDQSSSAVTSSERPVIGYVSHGTNDGNNVGLDEDYLGEFVDGEYQASEIDFQLANGAVFHTHESYNAESFEWWSNQGDGMIADWFELGGTAGLGHVAEPSNGPDNVTNEDLFYQALLPAGGADAAPGEAGLTFVEAAWRSTRQLSYVNTVVGDPLMQLQQWLPGDFNLDGSVNLFDLSILQNNWLGSGDFTAGDANFDGAVNLFDLSILQNNWLSSLNDQTEVIEGPLPSFGNGSFEVPEPYAAGLVLMSLLLRPIRARG